jgi:hypothetical protein
MPKPRASKKMNEIIRYLEEFSGDYSTAADAHGCPYRFSDLKEAAEFFQDGVFNAAAFAVSEKFGSYGRGIDAYKKAVLSTAKAFTEVKYDIVDLDRQGVDDLRTENVFIADEHGDVIIGHKNGWQVIKEGSAECYAKHLPRPSERQIAEYFKLM